MTSASPDGATSAGGRRFHLRRRLGAGAFGEVYLADMVSGGGFRRKVAIKLLHPEVARNRGAAKRMRDEARILGHLAHRHIVSVIDLIQLGDRWAVVMDYLPGADLEQVLARCLSENHPPPPGAVFEIGAAVSQALDAAWASDDGEGRPLRVVHRDIKPSNIRLTPDGDVRVLDFGVARVDMENREAATREAGWIGTERYMAPERIALLGDSSAGDVYALGASLIELLTGRPLGRTPVLPDKHRAMVDAALDRVRQRLGDHPAGPDTLAALAASVAAEPEDRPDAKALAATFDDLARRLGGPSLRAFAAALVPPLMTEDPGEVVDQVLTELAPLTTGSNPTIDLPQDEPDPPRRRTPMIVALVVAAVVLVGVGTVATAGVIAVGAGAWWFNSPAAATAPDLGDGEAEPVVGDAPDLAAEILPTDPLPPLTTAEPEAGAETDEGRTAPASADSAPSAAADPAPTSPSRPRAAPATTAPIATPIAAPPPDAPRVRAIKVLFSEGSSIQVTCGDVVASGSTSVAMRDVPSGPCTASVQYMGRPLSARFEVSRPAEILCRAEQEALSCAAR